jgi:hypothetical protein
VTLEAFGRFGNFSSFGEGESRYFNVKTKSFGMHIRPSTIGSVFAVERPGHMDGINTLPFQFTTAMATSRSNVADLRRVRPHRRSAWRNSTPCDRFAQTNRLAR